MPCRSFRLVIHSHLFTDIRLKSTLRWDQMSSLSSDPDTQAAVSRFGTICLVDSHGVAQRIKVDLLASVAE